MIGLGSRLKRTAQTAAIAAVLLACSAGSWQISAFGGRAAETQSLLGSYLAGRFARSQRDTTAAAQFYSRALRKDPKNEVILEQTFMLEAAAGNWDRALALAGDVIRQEKSHRIARFMLAAKAVRERKYATADKHFEAARKGPIADLTKVLARAWLRLAQKRPDEAFEVLKAVKNAEWSRFYERYHHGLIADLAGQRSAARSAFSRAFDKNARTLRIAEAYARHAVNAKNRKLAKQILRRHMAESLNHPLSVALLKEIEAGKTPPRLIERPIAGVAEVFYGIGDALTAEGGVGMGTIYLQLAIYLRPNFPLAHMALGEVYESNNKHLRAIAAYGRVDESSPLRMNTEIRKAFSLNALERLEEAKALLDRLAAKYPKSTRPLNTAGDILRSHKRYAEAKDYYARAIALVDKPQKHHWSLYYSRGVCYERLKQWPKAEADLKKAMKLDPNKPLVLNYLGYSWVDQGINLREAMKLIRKAVKLKPDDGYFVDSLGWAYYKLGNFEEAVKQLERAVELRPDDPVLNDHLGDAYWRVGRRFEANYQWTQALTLNPEPADVVKIKRKLAGGLKDDEKAVVRETTSDSKPKN